MQVKAMAELAVTVILMPHIKFCELAVAGQSGIDRRANVL
jgi:hypothetical protein